MTSSTFLFRDPVLMHLVGNGYRLVEVFVPAMMFFVDVNSKAEGNDGDKQKVEDKVEQNADEGNDGDKQKVEASLPEQDDELRLSSDSDREGLVVYR